MTSSHGPDGKSPPSPVKIHRFEKKQAPRGRSSEPRQREGSAHEHPTVPEFSLEPQKGGAAAEPARTEAPRGKERGASSRSAPMAASPEPRASAARESTPAGGRASVGGASSSGQVSELVATAEKLLSQGQVAQARSILDKLVALGIAGAPAYILLGTILMAQGNLERALECFDAALERDPEELSARLYRGEVRLEWGDLLLAEKDLQHVLDASTAGSPLVQQARRLLQRVSEQRNRRRR